ncbi:MAG: c-type cytochrome [Gammaproteobacteria bacterium]|nr:c-type cytochrome [Gammaproteobacteria bacterium]
MNKFKLSAFWQALLVIAAAYLIFDNAFPPLLPRTLMIQYMIITVAGVLLYFSFEEQRWTEFKAPILAVLRQDRTWPLRWLLLVAIPGVVGITVYDQVKPSFEAPVELRQVHPAPPSRLKVFGKNHDLSTLENPVRAQVLEQLGSDRAAALDTYNGAVSAGREVYFKNCFYCHGDLLDGQGPFADAFNPLPANFQDVGTIAQLQEAFLFWRIATGGPGLPKEGTPWNSAMPVWHEMLEEEDVWNVITFLYDYVGQVPRMWDQDTSRAVTGLKDEIKVQRASMDGQALYQYRCAACHGATGAGDGPAAEFLYPKPRDFSLGLFKYKTSPGTLPPRDEDLFDVIKHGLTGTGMPGWASLLNDTQIRSLIPVLKSFDVTATWVPEETDDESFDENGRYLKTDFRVITENEPVDGQIAYAEESLTRGRKVFEKTCEQCHGEAGRGNITSGKRLEDDWGNRIWPRDLTKPWSWRISNVADGEGARDETIRRIYQRLSIGIPGTPMPAHRAVEAANEDPLSTEQRWDVANYVYSLRENATPPPGESTVIRGVQAQVQVPATVDDPAWQQAPATTLRLAPNIIKEQRLFTPLADAVSVRVLYDETDIAFLLEVDDRTDSRPGVIDSEQIQDAALTLHPDAFAVQLPLADAFATTPVVVKPLYRHGDSTRPTRIWYWNAGSVEPVVAARTMVFDATGPDAKLAPRAEPAVTATGRWQQGRWRVLMKRPRQGDAAAVSFDEGAFIPVSFANWDGSNGEAGSKHTLTSWYWLLLPPTIDYTYVYGLPLGAALLVFLVGLLLVRAQRRGASRS